MLDSWGIGRYRESCRGRCRGSGLRQLKYREGIEQQRVKFKNRSSIDPAGVDELSRMQELSRSIHQVSRRCRDCIKNNAWEARQIARYRGGVKEVSSQLFKTVFRTEKDTDINAIQYTTQPMIQSTQKSLKLVFQSKKILSTRISKHTHTHTHTISLTNFIFQK